MGRARARPGPAPCVGAAGGDLCVAPASYGGACKRVQSFLSKSDAEKQELAVECKAPWPCQDDCAQGHDYSELCILFYLNCEEVLT